MDDKKNFGTRPLQERPPAQYQTVILTRNRILQKLLAVKPEAEAEAGSDPTHINLLVRGMSEQITLGVGKIAIIGRADFQMGGFQPDIDLTRYGAQERGVSRAHARLHVSKKTLYITDLYSANGTYLRGDKLDPEKPYEVNNGDEFVVGSLGVKVEFE